MQAQQALCQECGGEFARRRTDQLFCSNPHRQSFHKRMANRGQLLTPFVMGWRLGKRGSNDSSAWAMRQMAALADKWNAEDKAAGRPPMSQLLETRMTMCWSASDLD